MTQQLTVNDQLNIALNGTKAFQAKIASTSGVVPPDPVLDGHTVMANQLGGLADLFNKTAETVAKGYPAKTAMSQIAEQFQVDPEFIAKTAEYLDDLGALILKSAVLNTFHDKVRQKTAQTVGTAQPSDRVASAVNRLRQLANS